MQIPDLSEYSKDYRDLEKKLLALKPEDDPKSLLIAFSLGEMQVQPDHTGITCEYEELTAYCPWTKFPDQGSLVLWYQPKTHLLELKSFKFYLQAFRDRHITQEHLAQKILEDIFTTVLPEHIRVTLDYKPRGGIHTVIDLTASSVTPKVP